MRTYGGGPAHGNRTASLPLRYSDAIGVASDVAQESISNIRTTRSFAAEAVEAQKYAAAVGDPDAASSARDRCWLPAAPSSLRAGVRKALAQASFVGFTALLGFGGGLLSIWCACRRVG